MQQFSSKWQSSEERWIESIYNIWNYIREHEFQWTYVWPHSSNLQMHLILKIHHPWKDGQNWKKEYWSRQIQCDNPFTGDPGNDPSGPDFSWSKQKLIKHGATLCNPSHVGPGSHCSSPSAQNLRKATKMSKKNGGGRATQKITAPEVWNVARISFPAKKKELTTMMWLEIYNLKSVSSLLLMHLSLLVLPLCLWLFHDISGIHFN